MKETKYLLKKPINAARLTASINEIEKMINQQNQLKQKAKITKY